MVIIASGELCVVGAFFCFRRAPTITGNAEVPGPAATKVVAHESFAARLRVIDPRKLGAKSSNLHRGRKPAVRSSRPGRTITSRDGP
jgi:hypothetical protein